MKGFSGNVSRTTNRRWRRAAGVATVLAAASLALVTTAAGAANARSVLRGHSTRHASAPVVIKAAKRGSFGVILVTANGYTLYYDKSDTATKIACTGGCAQIWPPVVLPKGDHSAKAGNGVTQRSLGVEHRPGGALQVTYAGHPLYRYVQDASPGQVKGQGVGGFNVIKASATKKSATGGTPTGTSAPAGSGSTSPTTSPYGGGGY